MEKATKFRWIERIIVIKGVTEALSYMHQDCSPPIVHRDISSKNILLDLEHNARISDFSTAKILKPSSSNWSLFVGMFGFATPSSYFLLAWLISKKPMCTFHLFYCWSLFLEVWWAYHLINVNEPVNFEISHVQDWDKTSMNFTKSLEIKL